VDDGFKKPHAAKFVKMSACRRNGQLQLGGDPGGGAAGGTDGLKDGEPRLAGERGEDTGWVHVICWPMKTSSIVPR